MILEHFTGKLFIISLSFIVISIGVDLKLNYLPLNGLILISYVLFIFCLTLWVTSKLIREVLTQNKPIVYDFNKNPLLKYIKFGFIYVQNEFLSVENKRKNEIYKKNIDERIDDFTNDVEILIKKWFVLISEDETFLKESKGLVDEILRRFLQVLIDVDSKKLLHGVLVIFLNHVKEYQKAVRRQKKKNASIEELYRYSHIASNNNKAFEYIISQITSKLIRQFISWEVFNSIPCKTVTSILSKKLTANVLINLSSPCLINYKLASIYKNLEEFDSISLIDVDHEKHFEQPKIIVEDKDDFELQEKFISKSNTPKVSPKKIFLIDQNIINQDVIKQDVINQDIINQVEEKKEIIDEVDSIKTISSPVKIYESKSCEKTWRNSSDLECISLGQDLLVDFNDPESEITDLIGKKLWKDSEETDDKHEEKLEASTSIPNFISNSIKPIGNVTTTLQELQQTTVNNVVKPVSQVTSSAMHKIGDFQDEAAGVMEGIFDFGMAGLRKGLRLTGLQEGGELRSDFGRIKPVLMENFNEIKERGRKLSRVGPVSSEDCKSEKSLDEEVIWSNPLIKDSPNFDGQILLEKQPPIVSVSHDEISPDLEYEDTTDLATTTAKLRSLLQQRQTESNLTTPALSPMPIDETGRSLSTLSNSSFEDLTNVDGGALPSLYKFCARTATGVFQNTLNTLKTALPGNQNAVEENDFISIENVDHWTYVASDLTQEDLSIKMEKLLNERRAFCTVDNAYEAVESLDVLDQSWPTTKYDILDDVDDLELNIPLTKTLLDIFCESTPSLIPEALVKSILILFGSVIENCLIDYGKKMLKSVNGMIGKLPGGLQTNALALSVDELTEIFVDLIPGGLKYLVGEDVFRGAIKTLVLSLQSQKINQDVLLQIFELITSSVIEANCSLSPTYSA